MRYVIMILFLATHAHALNIYYQPVSGTGHLYANHYTRETENRSIRWENLSNEFGASLDPVTGEFHVSGTLSHVINNHPTVVYPGWMTQPVAVEVFSWIPLERLDYTNGLYSPDPVLGGFQTSSYPAFDTTVTGFDGNVVAHTAYANGQGRPILAGTPDFKTLIFSLYFSTWYQGSALEIGISWTFQEATSNEVPEPSTVVLTLVGLAFFSRKPRNS